MQTLPGVPSAADLAYADRRHTAAYWYAVGHSDATGEPDRSDAFADYARDAALAFRTGRTHHLPSVTAQWAQFRSELPAPIPT